MISKYQIFLCDIYGVSIIPNNLIGAEWCCIVQEKPPSSRDILLENLRRNMNVRVFVYTWFRFEIRILLCRHLSPILNLGFCVDTYPMLWILYFCFFFFVNSNHWCGGSSSRLLHELWKDPLLLLGYCRAREIWWSSRWILVSEIFSPTNTLIVDVSNRNIQLTWVWYFQYKCCLLKPCALLTFYFNCWRSPRENVMNTLKEGKKKKRE